MRDEGEQKPEVRSQKKRKSVNAVLSLFILDSGFWIPTPAFLSSSLIPPPSSLSSMLWTFASVECYIKL